MSNPNEVLYTPLKDNQIRVIHLTSTSLVDTDNDAPHQDLAITCDMRIVSLDDVKSGQKSYHALSYCWGSPHHRRHVTCNGVPLPVTRNLYNALWHCLFSSDSPSPILWVDAICINQSDNAERGQQVSLMGDIYRQAASVLVWLGTSEDLGTGDIFSYWQWLAGGADPAQRPSERTVDLGQDYILRSSWFRRAWTFQEIVLPRRAIMRCGMYTFGWDVLSRQPAFESLIGGIEDLRLGSEGSSARLTPLLKLTQNRQSTDPRDRLYALLGMYKGSAEIRPDYNRSLRDVLRIIADVVIHKEANLSVLGLANVPVLNMASAGDYVLVRDKPVKVAPKEGQDERTMLMLGHDDDYDRGDNYLVKLPVDLRKYVESVDDGLATNQPLTSTQHPEHHRGKDWHPDFLDLSESDVLDYMHEQDAHETAYRFHRIHPSFTPSFHDRSGRLVARGLILGRWIPLLRHAREKIWRRPNPSMTEVIHRGEFDKSKTTGVVLPLPPCVETALAASRLTVKSVMRELPPANDLEEADIRRVSKLCQAHDARRCACDDIEWAVLAELVPDGARTGFVYMPFGAAGALVVRPDWFDGAGGGEGEVEGEGTRTVKLMARCKGFGDVHWPLRHAMFDRGDHRLRSSDWDPEHEVNLSCVLVELEIANETAELAASTFPGRGEGAAAAIRTVEKEES